MSGGRRAPAAGPGGEAPPRRSRLQRLIGAARRPLRLFRKRPTPPPPVIDVGHFDGLFGAFASGWVWDPDAPDAPATVEFLVDGRVIHRATASITRPDVTAAGFGRGLTGFQTTLPLDLNVGDVEVRARLAGTALALQQSPRTATLPPGLAKWQARKDRVAGVFRQRLAKRLARGVDGLRLTIVVPVYNTRADWLTECLDSVLDQWCPNWELICVDDASASPETANVLEAFARRDPRVRVIRNRENLGIAKATNVGIFAAAGSHVAFLDHDDRLEPDAVFQLLRASKTGAELIYSDEIITGERLSDFISAQLRPAYSWDYYINHPYFVHLVCVRADVARAVGGWDETMTISGDVDFVLRVSERATAVAHVPAILYRWRTHGGSAGHQRKDEVVAATSAALNRHLARVSPGASAAPTSMFNHFRTDFPDPGGRTLVVIPTRNRVDLLSVCVESIRRTTGPDEVDILVVDHESDDPELARYLQSRDDLTTLRQTGPFNYARLNNLAVAAYRRERGGLPAFVLFCNNDIEAMESGWLARMRSLAGRAEVGAVGATLLYPDDTIQHSGVIVGLNGPAEHAHKRAAFWHQRPTHRNVGPIGAILSTRDYSAVTAACLLMRSSVFEEVGGFDEDLAVGFNDTDLCLRIGRRGLKILNDAAAVLYHHESASRRAAGTVAHPDDAALFAARWSDVLATGDVYYNPMLSADLPDHRQARFSIDRPAPRVTPGLARDPLSSGAASPAARR